VKKKQHHAASERQNKFIFILNAKFDCSASAAPPIFMLRGFSLIEMSWILNSCLLMHTFFLFYIFHGERRRISLPLSDAKLIIPARTANKSTTRATLGSLCHAIYEK
jgi:hypothetical protein